MKKTLLLALSAAALATPALHAQIAVKQGGKMDIKIERLTRDFNEAKAKSRTAAADTLVNVIVTCHDAETVAGNIQTRGGQAHQLSATLLTAEIPASRLAEIAALKEVENIAAPQQFQPLMTTSRRMTNADKVQRGEGLETPYTGKGVVIGVIDQGFQYNHIAFKDEQMKTRVHSIWNLSVKNSSPVKGVPVGQNYDLIAGAAGHGTHVTGIAAGSRIAGNEYYGMAPEATIVMIPSTLSEDQIMKGAQYIKSVAQELDYPWVTNMSFGSQIGPHDGSGTDDQYLSNLCGAGGIIVGAMGNEGAQKIHAAHEFTAAGQIKKIVVSAPAEGYAYNCIDLWGNATDGKQHMEVTPCWYNPTTRKYTALSDEDMKKVAPTYGGEINAQNHKEHYTFYINHTAFLNFTGNTQARFALEIKSLEPNITFHAWSNSGWGEFERPTSDVLAGNSSYLVGEGAASIPNAIAVASYTGAGNWTAASDGQSYMVPGETSGSMSSFSSPGPWLGNEKKPTVSAPGGNIASAFNKYESFKKEDVFITNAVNSRTGAKQTNYNLTSITNSDYYGIKSGTSMATPAVTGIVALWLQANPTLTPEQVKEIIRNTSTRYQASDTDGWGAKSGYGKIDAYAGLKVALELSTVNGIGETTIGSDSPVTLQKSANSWRILFNRAEPVANISVMTMSGNVVSRQALCGMQPGNEAVVSLEELPAGAYLIRISTQAADLTRKVIR